MKNEPEALTLEDMKLLQRKLFNFCMDGLDNPEAPAVVVSTAYKLVDSARLDPATGNVSATEQLINDLPDEFKVHIKNRPEWSDG